MTVFGPTAGANRSDGIFKIVGFATEDHEVVVLAEIFGQDSRWFGEGHVAARAAKLETLTAQLRGALWTDEKGHVPIYLEQPAAKIAANRARSHHQGTHALDPRASRIQRGAPPFVS